MEKRALQTTRAPRPVGPYSQGVEAGGFVFVAGQVGFEPASGNLVEGVAAQTERTLRNIEAILEAAGTSLSQAVKISVFLADLGHFKEMNGVYEQFAPASAPARTTVQAVLPLDVHIEIDVIALVAAGR